jgi:hypothetical protein
VSGRRREPGSSEESWRWSFHSCRAGQRAGGKVSIGAGSAAGRDLQREIAHFADDALAEVDASVREAIASGAVRGMSFRFTIPDGKEKWFYDTEDAIPERTILEVNCMEAGPVTFPAYVETEAAVRSRHVIYLARAVKELRLLGVSDDRLRDEFGIILGADEPVDDDDHSDDSDEDIENLDEDVTDADEADETDSESDLDVTEEEAESEDADEADSTSEISDEPVNTATDDDHSDEEPVEEPAADHSDSEDSNPESTPSDEVEAPPVQEDSSPRSKEQDDILFRHFDALDWRASLDL